jgi:lipoprotein-anchoring transpeptidase ErfK/SrfK
MAREFIGSTRRLIGQSRNWIFLVITLILFVAVVATIFKWRRPPADSQAQPSDAQPAAPLAVETQPKSELTTGTPEMNKAPGPDIANIIADAVVLVTSQPEKVIEVRDKLNAALQLSMNPQQQRFVKEQLSKLSDKWLFGPTVCTGDMLCESHTVKPGERLTVIAEKFKVPYEILMQINNIRQAESLQAGQTIKVIKGPFHGTVTRSTFTFDLYLQNTFVRSFSVGLGKPGRETPVGVWRVKLGGKLVSPPWTDPDTGRAYKASDPDYPLGSRWISLEGIDGPAKGRDGFAIHGTKTPEQIGTAASRGCIRLHNGDAILVYNLLVPGYSRVRVLD